MSIISSLLGKNAREIARFEIRIFYPDLSVTHPTILPRIEVDIPLRNGNIEIEEILYLTAPLFAEFSFFHLTQKLRLPQIDSWKNLLTEKAHQPPVNNISDLLAGSIIVNLKYGSAPFITTKVKFTPGQIPAYSIFADAAKSFYLWSLPQISLKMNNRLQATLSFGLERWSSATPKSTATTWNWHLWIDYPSWVHKATGDFSIGKLRPLYEYRMFKDNRVGITVQYPSFFLPELHIEEISKAVLFGIKPGEPDLQIFKDSGRFFPVDDPSITPEKYINYTYDDFRSSFKKGGRNLEWLNGPTKINIANLNGIRAEFIETSGYPQSSFIQSAAVRIDKNTIGGVLLISAPEQVWMRRDMFNKICSSLSFQ